MSDIPISSSTARLVCLALALCLLFFAAGIWLLPTDPFSATENRPLASLPDPAPEAVLSGEYARRLSAFLSDHLPWRADLLRLRAAAEYGMGKRENNAVLRLRDGSLVKRFDYTDHQLAVFRQNAADLRAFLSAVETPDAPALFLCAPRGVDVLVEDLEAPARSVRPILEAVCPEALTVTEGLRGKALAGEAVWYRTDHHWTTEGAFFVYQALGEALGYTPYPKEAFTAVTVATDFLGTSYSASLAPAAVPDSIVALRYEGDEALIAVDTSTGKTAGLYRPEALATHDKYAYFLGSNTAHVRISAHSGEPRPTLLLIKDSFAMSLAPLLARHFDIEMLDLRYIRTDPRPQIEELLSSPRHAGTLILMGADTLCEHALGEKIKNFSKS